MSLAPGTSAQRAIVEMFAILFVCFLSLNARIFPFSHLLCEFLLCFCPCLYLQSTYAKGDLPSETQQTSAKGQTVEKNLGEKKSISRSAETGTLFSSVFGFPFKTKEKMEKTTETIPDNCQKAPFHTQSEK